MPSTQSKKDAIRAELESTRSRFHALLDSLSDEDLRKKSLNPGWTNREILFHMTLGFIILSSLIGMARFMGRLPKRCSKVFSGMLNGSTGVFNWINSAGARGGGRVYGRERIGRKFEAEYSRLLKRLDGIKEDDLRRGMYYPTRWDPLFREYMTLEDIFHYPTAHFKFHLGQISR